MGLLRQKCSGFSFTISFTPINRYYRFICLTLVFYRPCYCFIHRPYLFPQKNYKLEKYSDIYNLLPIPMVFRQCFVEVKDFSEYRFALSEFVLQTDGQVELFICCQQYYDLQLIKRSPEGNLSVFRDIRQNYLMLYITSTDQVLCKRYRDRNKAILLNYVLISYPLRFPLTLRQSRELKLTTETQSKLKVNLGT